MKFQKLPAHLTASVHSEDFDIPEEILVLNEQGTAVARYTRAEDQVGCHQGKPAEGEVLALDAVELDDLTREVIVVESPLPERVGLQIRFPGPCGRHGWDCQWWIRETVFVRT